MPWEMTSGRPVVEIRCRERKSGLPITSFFLEKFAVATEEQRYCHCEDPEALSY